MQGRLSQEFRDRTKQFASGIIRLFIALPKNREEVHVLGKQMLRSGTSVAAQVREANRARSTAEFISNLGGACQEVDETQLWLEFLRADCRISEDQITPIEQKASELLAIMVTMIKNSKS